MVGVPIRNKCDNCRIRKKKCGEQRPSCAECIRSGWNCPGYPPRWKFMNETPRLKKLYSRKKYIFESDDTSPDAMSPEKAILSPTEYGSDMFLFEDFQVVSLEVPRFHYNNPLATKLMYCLGCKVKGNLLPLWLSGSFFQYIPGRLGHNIALDDAISCVCSLYCDRSSNEYTKSNAIYRNYVRALSSLQKCLTEENVCLQSETLCASILLQMCELAVNVDKAKWSGLSRGTSQLIEARGIGRYKDPFDLGMLESQLSYIVIQSAKFQEDCYLRKPEWRALLATTSAWPSNTVSVKELKSLELRIQLCHQLFELPSVLMEASSFYQNSGGLLAGSYPVFMNQILEMCSKMKAWLSSEVEPHIFHKSLDTVGTEVQYSDPIAGVVDCVANTTLLTLDRVICSLYHGSTATNKIDTFDDPEIVEGWYRRALVAYDSVNSESTFAAKPLGIGLQQFQSSSPKPLSG
ncbi:hypothetical protein BCIN_13g01990 [Botrytis cinerea B05.10]|uniref:Zn(2)-C6 fungal-type domain-containing protein n=1 Tax=Botryotinia fuckeliana (strain B05.10) TaxID=332648 RepID=A0A384K0P2_BOTFB|nr:hypothetical protein BCIN_13g01990 [Botrytis cinerea B05.10]ATZ56358.1 hypothetical protein BCIN_13g01990 [Botrytis cinerea B05.10]